jgi:hypothetical protein
MLAITILSIDSGVVVTMVTSKGMVAIRALEATRDDSIIQGIKWEFKGATRIIKDLLRCQCLLLK